MEGITQSAENDFIEQPTLEQVRQWAGQADLDPDRLKDLTNDISDMRDLLIKGEDGGVFEGNAVLSILRDSGEIDSFVQFRSRIINRVEGN